MTVHLLNKSRIILVHIQEQPAHPCDGNTCFLVLSQTFVAWASRVPARPASRGGGVHPRSSLRTTACSHRHMRDGAA
jgi:hypothetical protein